jgi:hypothetical protein
MEVTPMTEMMPDVNDAKDPNPAAGLDGLDEQLINQLVDQAKTGGLRLVGCTEIVVGVGHHDWADHATRGAGARLQVAIYESTLNADCAAFDPPDQRAVVTRT